MAYETIITEIKDNHIGLLTLNRPDSMNTFSSQMAKELNQALVDLSSSSSTNA